MKSIKPIKLSKQFTDYDCFPTCFRNALKILNVEIKKDLEDRLDVFNMGVENCTPSFSTDNPKIWNSSIEKFMEEWENSQYSKLILDSMNMPKYKTEKWTKDLIDLNISIDLNVIYQINIAFFTKF